MYGKKSFLQGSKNQLAEGGKLRLSHLRALSRGLHERERLHVCKNAGKLGVSASLREEMKVFVGHEM